jgi:simple sugar transport system permease protein
MQQSFAASIPLVLGALCGCMSERSGVINIAIEGQLLMGAFTGAIVASAVGSLWLGLISGSLAAGLLGLLLAVFAITFFVDQIILGVVLNVLALGLTGFLYDRLMVPNPDLNAGSTFNTIKIPVLGDIPIIGPIFFNSTIFLYITYALIIVIQIGLFRTRWGLRVRAVGEHPTAADTVGIKVLWTRYRNVILGGMVAGIGGAYLTIGSVGFFNKDISAGQGFIALAAMIFGRWTPLGSVAAALLFGFSATLAQVISTLNVPLDSSLLLMTPYLATIIAVAGLVGKVRAPAADGKPYVKA